jgi:hypothetical protein
MMEQANKLFEYAILLMEKNESVDPGEIGRTINQELQQLLKQRKMEIESGIASPESFRKKLSELKTIVEQFELICSNLEEELKILKEIKEIRPLSLQTAEPN